MPFPYSKSYNKWIVGPEVASCLKFKSHNAPINVQICLFLTASLVSW
jgi:hypothetical protein